MSELVGSWLGEDERYWTREIARVLKGKDQFRLLDGSVVDILDEHRRKAIEVDWLEKWAEAVGQACLYASMTGFDPVVMLLVKPSGEYSSEEHKQKLILRAAAACAKASVSLNISLLPSKGVESE